MKSRDTRHKGMALIAVLWLTAAMSLIVTGVVKSVRLEARSIGLQRQSVTVGALADATLLLALQSLHAAQPPGIRAAIQSVPVTFQGQAVTVQVLPLNGLIDINNATVVLLTDLYRYVGDLAPASALALAQTTFEVRQTKNAKGAVTGFDAPEDLLRVPGFTYDLYAKINCCVTADLRNGNGRIYPKAAPYQVLLVMTGGDASRSKAFVNQRTSDAALADTSFLKPELIDMAPSNSLKLQVELPLPDGVMLHREWLVAMTSDPRSGLPWRVLGTRQVIGSAL